MGHFRVLLTVQVVSGREVEFEHEWLAGRDVIAGHPSNRGHWLSRAKNDSSTYYVMSDWIDEASFREFERSKAHLSHRQKLHPFRVSGSMVTMSVLSGCAHAAATEDSRSTVAEGAAR
ncbi:antibiotic biosynthesis monooxygenase family protein [Salinispora oceanensis]|uniref:antibiotic biosynthesis monooxygenase family protein n=1 Tax=Salinispora oceanensis TaxID=1050199 RepID=UPI000375E60D|nr:antibiotic biosynthesis monooxygenase [Salinispora oceanensis]